MKKFSEYKITMKHINEDIGDELKLSPLGKIREYAEKEVRDLHVKLVMGGIDSKEELINILRNIEKGINEITH